MIESLDQKCIAMQLGCQLCIRISVEIVIRGARRNSKAIKLMHFNLE
jgi:hypothetical protein